MDTAIEKIAETKARFIAEQTEKMSEAERRIDVLSQDLVKARMKNERSRLLAPVSGVVQQLALTTKGQVVNPGQVLMTIVPPDAELEAQAFIENQDVGFVHTGQPVVLKIESFPFTRYGTLNGTLKTISAEGVDKRSALNLSTAAAAATATAQSGRDNDGSALVFPATITLERSFIDVDGKRMSLRPGMNATAEIATGSRRLLSYLLSPVTGTLSSAGHER